MATFLFSASSGTIAFNPLVDKFNLDFVSATNSDVITTIGLDINETPAGVTFTFSGKSVTLSGVTIQQLVSSTSGAGTGNIFYDQTGSLTFGDQTTSAPDAAQSISNGMGASALDDILFGGDGGDTISGGQGNDQLIGGAGDDQLRGGMGNDTITGGAGNDFLAGATGSDVISGGDGNDLINETGDVGVTATNGEANPPGNNILAGNAGDDTILGGTGDDLISGGMDNDVLRGGGGNDDIRGGDGNDTLEGGSGDDALSGGAGSDEFVFSTDANFVAGSDQITGFARGSDKIVLVDGSGAELSAAAIATTVSSIIVSGPDSIVTLTNGQTIRVAGVNNLDATDFKNAATPNVTINDVAVTEGGMATFTVTLSAASAFDTTITYSTGGGTATEGVDYTSGDGGVLIIAAGMTTGSIVINTTADNTAEGNETFNVTLGSATNATITDNTGVGTINNDDTGPTVSLSSPLAPAENVATTIDSTVTVTSGTSSTYTSLNVTSSAASSMAVNTGAGLVTITSNGFVLVDDDGVGGGSATVVGTITGNTTNNMTVTLNSSATASHIETFLESLQLTSTNVTDKTVNVTLTDSNGNQGLSTVNVDTTATTPLAITNLPGDSILVTIADAATKVDAGATADQNYLTSQTGFGNYSNATLNVALSGATNASDTLTIGGAAAPFASVVGNFVLVDDDGVLGGSSTIIGTVTGNSSQNLTVTLNSSASDALVDRLLNQIVFDTTAGDGDRTATFTLTNTANGHSAVAATTVSVASTVLNLTADADTVAGGIQGDSLLGTSGVDVFKSLTTGFLQTLDTLDGAGGTSDRLQAVVDETNAAPVVSNIEIFELQTDVTGGADSLNLASVTGLSQIYVTPSLTGGPGVSVEDLTLNNIGNGVTLVDAGSFGGSLTANFAAGTNTVNAIGGSGNDAFNFGNTLNGGSGDTVDGNGGSDTVTGTISANYTAHLADVESVTITAGADFTIDLADVTGTAGATTVNLVDGAATDVDLTVTNVGSAIGALNASLLDDGASSVNVTVGSGSGTLALTGSAGNDTLAFGSTLDASDDIDGGTGTDTLSATLAAAYTAGAGNLDNVEVLDLTTTASVAVNLASATGVTTANLTLNNNNNDSTLTVANSVTSITITGTGTDDDVTVTPGTGLTSLNASGVTDSNSSLTVSAAGGAAITITGTAGNDTITGSSNGDNLIGGNGNDSINGGTGGNDTVTAGAGNDTINMGVDLTNADDIDGGSNTDTLSATLGADFTAIATLLDNVENLSFTIDTAADGNAVNVNVAAATGVTSVTQTYGANNNNDGTLTVGSSVTTVTLTGGGTDQDITVAGAASFAGFGLTTVNAGGLTDAGSSLTINASGLTTGLSVTGTVAGADSIILGSGNDTVLAGGGNDSITAGTGNDNLSGEGGADVFTFAADALTTSDSVNGGVGGGDSLTTSFSDTAGPDNTSINLTNITDVETITLDIAEDDATVTINTGVLGTDLTSLVLTDAVASVDVNLGTLDSQVNNVNASGLNGGGTLTVTASSTATTIVGAENGTGVAGDTITGGSGNDSITGGTGGDLLTGGAGADRFIYTGATAAAFDAETNTGAPGRDRITDFAIGDDVIDVSAFLGATNIAFMGTGAFVVGGAVGEVRYALSGADTVIQFDLNDDGAADASIILTGNYTLAASDFLGVV